MRELLWFLIPLWLIVGLSRVVYAIAYATGMSAPSVASSVINNTTLAIIAFGIAGGLIWFKRKGKL